MALGRGRSRFPSQSNINPMMQTTSAPTQQYGLQGAENALLTGAQFGLNQLGQTQGQVGDLYGAAQNTLSGATTNTQNLYGQGIQGLQPYQTAGAGASGLQAALTGASGQQAQAQAIQDYQSSPYVQQARDIAERAITRNAAATGNLGSGNTMDQLYQNAAGMFMQDYGNRINQLGGIAGQGLSAASTGAGLRGQQAGIQSGLSQYGAGLSAQEAGLQANLGQNMAQIPMQTGQQIAGYRSQAGRDIANAAQQTTSSLANLISQQGAGSADIVGNYANNINALYQQASQGDANAQQQLAGILANLATQSGSTVAGLPIIQGQPTNMLGQVGQLASGIGGMMGGIQSSTPAPTNQDIYGAQMINDLRIPTSMLTR